MAVPPERVTSLEADRVVKAPVVGVVAPTVPLMLIEAVPVRFVTVPLDGVPNAPPLTTGAPAVPTLTAKAVAIPVPRPDTPVEIGRPVAFVRVALDGVPRAGVTKVGDVARTLFPVPVLVTLTTFLLASKARAVEAVNPESVVVPDALSVVNAPAAAVVVPTGPLNESPAAPV